MDLHTVSAHLVSNRCTCGPPGSLRSGSGSPENDTSYLWYLDYYITWINRGHLISVDLFLSQDQVRSDPVTPEI